MYRITITGFYVSCPRRFWSESRYLKVLGDSPMRDGVSPISWLELLMCRQERKRTLPIYYRNSIVNQQKSMSQWCFHFFIKKGNKGAIFPSRSYPLKKAFSICSWPVFSFAFERLFKGLFLSNWKASLRQISFCSNDLFPKLLMRSQAAFSERLFLCPNGLGHMLSTGSDGSFSRYINGSMRGFLTSPFHGFFPRRFGRLISWVCSVKNHPFHFLILSRK